MQSNVGIRVVSEEHTGEPGLGGAVPPYPVWAPWPVLRRHLTTCTSAVRRDGAAVQRTRPPDAVSLSSPVVTGIRAAGLRDRGRWGPGHDAKEEPMNSPAD